MLTESLGDLKPRLNLDKPHLNLLYCQTTERTSQTASESSATLASSKLLGLAKGFPVIGSEVTDTESCALSRYSELKSAGLAIQASKLFIDTNACCSPSAEPNIWTSEPKTACAAYLKSGAGLN